MTSSVPVCCWVLIVVGYICLYIVSEVTLPPEPAYTQELGPVSCCVHMACKKSPKSSKCSMSKRFAILPNPVIPCTQCCWVLPDTWDIFSNYRQHCLLDAAGSTFRGTWPPIPSAWDLLQMCCSWTKQGWDNFCCQWMGSCFSHVLLGWGWAAAGRMEASSLWVQHFKAVPDHAAAMSWSRQSSPGDTAHWRESHYLHLLSSFIVVFDRIYKLSRPKDSLPCPSFKEARDIIILSELSCKGNMFSLLAVLGRENKPGDNC